MIMVFLVMMIHSVLLVIVMVLILLMLMNDDCFDSFCDDNDENVIFKTKIPNEDIEFDNNDSNDVDSDFKEVNIEVPNNYRCITQKIKFKKKESATFLSKRKIGVFQNKRLNIYK
ncbi:hypothetical protein RhiirC2_796335 [Rhizophagus irregularis]|uniref:Uncharacterized protein n=1 Tax=Rhizophagus irregularis TaxID=588596 RepID=A0A2N1M9V8_9GLOM|nr:hypothetical protein RhiirC2_796335 [Rhizophagus irregularis]